MSFAHTVNTAVNRTVPSAFRLFFLIVSSLAVFGFPAYGADEDQTEAVLDLPLERLLDVSVVSASRKNQSLSDVASAVFVINEDDIRHSGATTIPDLLRMVPGVQVASIDGTSWAVSVRGFNGLFANKLLVMIDGRTVYTPLFGGVLWDVQDTLLDNIERIEVVRGSGSTMWGANAVNGVINIITKHSQDTVGGLATGLVGSRERGTVGVRYGAEVGASSSYRIYLKHVERAGTPTLGMPAADTLSMTRGGFRFDSTPAEGVNVTLLGDLYGGTADHSYTVPTFTPPFSATSSPAADLLGGNLLSRVDWLTSDTSKFSFQLYYDRTGRDTPFVKEDRDTVDLDLQHNVRLAGVHEVTWGAGYRFLHDRTPGDAFFSLDPASRSNHLLNLFLQDEITLVPDQLRLILGTKLEHNDFTGWEVEPSAKLSWTLRRGYSLWASVSRAVRTPTRGESDLRIPLTLIPANPQSPLPTQVVLLGNSDLKPESVLAYELGFRADLSNALSLDVTSFYYRYSDLVSAQLGAPSVSGGMRTVPDTFSNLNSCDSSGAEVSLQWQALEWWKLKGGYSYIQFFGSEAATAQGSKATPSHQATLRSFMALGRDVDLDLWARYQSHSTSAQQNSSVHTPAYLTLDARAAWRVAPGWELALVGQNLLERRHLEAVSEQTAAEHEVERSVYGKVTWEF